MLLKFGNIMWLIAIVQILNAVKVSLGLIDSDDSISLQWILFTLNTIYDLFAFMLIAIYVKYYRKCFTFLNTS